MWGRGERGIGEHRVFWCEEVSRPLRKVPGEESERTWRSWQEVEDWERDK